MVVARSLMVVQLVRSFQHWEQKNAAKVVQTIRSHYFPKQSDRLNRSAYSIKKCREGEEGLSLDSALEQIEAKGKLKETASQKGYITLSLVCDLPKEHANGIRGVLAIPYPILKKLNILVFAPPHLHETIKERGATIVGGSELIDPIIEGKLEFNRCLATTDMMPVVAKLGRVLGQRGLVPTIKTGTLTNDIVEALEKIHSNVPFRIEKDIGILNISVGTLSEMNMERTKANIQAVFKQLDQAYGKLCKNGRFIKMAKVCMHNSKALLLASSVYYNPKRISNVPQFILDAMDRQKAKPKMSSVSRE